MNPREFFINPADYGLPTRDELVAYRIWDNHSFASENPIEQYERNNFFVECMGIERSVALGVRSKAALRSADSLVREKLTSPITARTRLSAPHSRLTVTAALDRTLDLNDIRKCLWNQYLDEGVFSPAATPRNAQ